MNYCSAYFGLVGELRFFVKPEEINIKAFLLSFCSARYQESRIQNPHESHLGKIVGRGLKFMIFSSILATFKHKQGQTYVKKLHGNCLIHIVIKNIILQ